MAPAGECGLIPDCDETQQTSGWDDLRDVLGGLLAFLTSPIAL